MGAFFFTCLALCQPPGLLFWCRKRLRRDGYGVDGTISGGTSMATCKLFFKDGMHRVECVTYCADAGCFQPVPAEADVEGSMPC